MKHLRLILVTAIALACCAEWALARGHRGGAPHRSGASHFGGVHSAARVGVFVGAPLLARAYYPFYDRSYAPIYSAPLAIEYIEKDAGDRSPSDYWYYCLSPAAYYPYVKECPGGWQTVEPLPQ